MKIVIVEDEIRIRQGIANLINKLYQKFDRVLEAQSGEEGLTLIREYDPDIVITDIRMEPMDGLEMLKILTQQEKRRFKTIILSAYSEFDYARQAISLGVCEYLLKPVDLEEFNSVMTAVINDVIAEKGGREARPDLLENGKQEGIIILRAKRIVEKYYHKGLTLEELAQKMFLTPEYISSQFVKELGVSFSVYIRQFRINRAKELLINSNLKLYEVAEKVGYSNAKYFSKVFREAEGVLPTDYRQKYYMEKNHI